MLVTHSVAAVVLYMACVIAIAVVLQQATDARDNITKTEPCNHNSTPSYSNPDTSATRTTRLDLITRSTVQSHSTVKTESIPSRESDACTDYSSGLQNCSLLGSFLNSDNKDTSLTKTFQSVVNIVEAYTVLAIIIATAVMYAFMLHMLSCYRKHMRRLWKGDHSFLPKKLEVPSVEEEVSGSISYTGQQISFIVYGWLVMWLTMFLVFSIITIISLLIIHSNTFLAAFVIPAMTSFLVAVLTDYLQQVVSRVVFTDKEGLKFPINNRRFLHLFQYFSVFTNIIAGLLEILQRIISSIGLGIVFLSRLDKSLLIRGYEMSDEGYEAYIMTLFNELRHSHPVARVFLQLLVDSSIKPNPEVNLREAGDEERPSASTTVRVRPLSRVARNRWQLAYTLNRNPSIKSQRWHRIRDKKKRKDDDGAENQGCLDFVRKKFQKAPKQLIPRTGSKAADEQDADAHLLTDYTEYKL